MHDGKGQTQAVWSRVGPLYLVERETSQTGDSSRSGAAMEQRQI